MTDLNHIQLPASLVAGIYKNHLVEVDGLRESPRAKEKKKTASKEQPRPIEYLGQNTKGVCVLVDYADDVYLPDNQLTFLTSILQACKLNLGDVAIINCHRQPVSFAAITEQLSCNYVLIFGLSPAKADLPDMPLFTIHQEAGCQMLYAPAAENLNNAGAESKLLKTKLWLCLKQLFAV